MNMQSITTMNRPKTFERQLKIIALAAISCAVLVTLSIAFVDRPVFRFVYQHQRFDRLYEVMAAPSLLSLPLAGIYLLVFAFSRLSGTPRGRYTSLCLTLSMAVVTANAAKDELKWLIGRPWPMEWWTQGVYHLQPFTDSGVFGSFPSGHTTYVAAPMFVLWWRLPQYRAIWMAITAMVMIGLVGYGFHFVADVIAGFFLGMAAAGLSVALIPK
jgi:membrane-associated phospholipid phosphatase